MGTEVENSVILLLERAPKTGRQATAEEINAINRDCGNIIPGWYAALLCKYPICGLELGWQKFEAEDDFDGIEWVEWSNPEMMRAIMLDGFPFDVLCRDGFLNVAALLDGDDNPYFININEGENPPVLQIYHDASPKLEIILKEGIDVVAGSLSEFFANSIV